MTSATVAGSVWRCHARKDISLRPKPANEEKKKEESTGSGSGKQERKWGSGWRAAASSMLATETQTNRKMMDTTSLLGL
jgi:hypothetical protein